MNCVIPSTNVKGKAIQSLSKIGDELYLEATSDQLTFITLNISKTVCIKHHFLYSFFSSYEINEDEVKKTEKITCKIHMKILLPLFKGTSLEKKLEWIKIYYKSGTDLIEFRMKYKCDDILMIHKLRLMDKETLTVKIDLNSFSNTLSASSTVFNQMLSVFSASDDITFEISSNKIVTRNYFIGAPHNSKTVRSQVNLQASEFNLFVVKKDVNINFSSKPLRTAINFAESFNLNVTSNMDQGGRPLGIIMKHATFEVEYIIATLDPYSDAPSTRTASSIPTKLSQNSLDQINISMEDQQALENENWDDLSMESDENNAKKNKKESFKVLMNKAAKRKKKSTEVDKPIEQVKIIPETPSLPEPSISEIAKVVFRRALEQTYCMDLGEALAGNSDSE